MYKQNKSHTPECLFELFSLWLFLTDFITLTVNHKTFAYWELNPCAGGEVVTWDETISLLGLNTFVKFKDRTSRSRLDKIWLRPKIIKASSQLHHCSIKQLFHTFSFMPNYVHEWKKKQILFLSIKNNLSNTMFCSNSAQDRDKSKYKCQ